MIERFSGVKPVLCLDTSSRLRSDFWFSVKRDLHKERGESFSVIELVFENDLF